MPLEKSSLLKGFNRTSGTDTHYTSHLGSCRVSFTDKGIGASRSIGLHTDTLQTFIGTAYVFCVVCMHVGTACNYPGSSNVAIKHGITPSLLIVL